MTLEYAVDVTKKECSIKVTPQIDAILKELVHKGRKKCEK